MYICKNCQMEFDGNVCPNCGETKDFEKICPRCKSRLLSSADACAECGYAFTESVVDGGAQCGSTATVNQPPKVSYSYPTYSDSAKYNQTKSADRPKKKSGFLSFIIVLLVVYVGLATMDAFGYFVTGTYYECSESGELDESSTIILNSNGQMGGNDGEAGLTYVIIGENISFYLGEAKFYGGTISNGVIKAKFVLEEEYTYFCKAGQTQASYGSPCFMDTFRKILAPASKIISDLIY